MRIVWHQRPHLERKLEIAHAFAQGLSGDDTLRIVHGFDGVEKDADALVLFGIGGIAKSIWLDYLFAGKRLILIDKGYSRRTGHWRVSVNAFQPLAYFQQQRSAERFERLGVTLAPYEARGDAILFDGASQKYCDWHALGQMDIWGELMVERMRRNTTRKVIYRPRPTHNTDVIPVCGASFSEGPLADDFARAALVASYGGNIGWDAVIAGIPHFAIGDSIAGPVSETAWPAVGTPYIPAQAEREQWCADVAWCQWTLAEISSGEAWQDIRRFV